MEKYTIVLDREEFNLLSKVLSKYDLTTLSVEEVKVIINIVSKMLESKIDYVTGRKENK